MIENKRKLFSSESVTEGHPDKIADIISDAILDEMLRYDPMSRVACEVTVTTGLVVVVGEITTNAQVDIQGVVRECIRQVGYDRAKYGFDCDTCAVLTAIDKQSPDIAMGVNNSLEAKSGERGAGDLGAGDQGIMFGYACNETPELMPLAISLAHKLTERLSKVRKSGEIDYIRPDGKSQVTIVYDENDVPCAVDTVVVSTQHSDTVTQEELKKDIMEKVILPVIPKELLSDETKYYINPTGRFVVGGPQGDSGHTGRKLIVDTYGGAARHGGGAFSGKDPTKVDRSAAYAARYAAKNVVAAGLADRCELQLAYAIGVAEPVSVRVDTFGTAKVEESLIEELVAKHFDLRPSAIIEKLDLRRPIYKQTASYGHFGRPDLDLPWEKTDKAEILKKEAAAR